MLAWCVLYIISNGLALFITEPELKRGGDERKDGLGEWKESSLSTEVSNPISFVPACISSGVTSPDLAPPQILLPWWFFPARPFVVLLGRNPWSVFLGLYTRSNFLLGLKAGAGDRQEPPGDCTALQINAQDGYTKMGNSTSGCSWRCL